jgi:hypothetical protein
MIFEFDSFAMDFGFEGKYFESDYKTHSFLLFLFAKKAKFGWQTGVTVHVI